MHLVIDVSANSLTFASALFKEKKNIFGLVKKKLNSLNSSRHVYESFKFGKEAQQS
jgi:hypothetical protein